MADSLATNPTQFAQIPQAARATMSEKRTIGTATKRRLRRNRSPTKPFNPIRKSMPPRRKPSSPAKARIRSPVSFRRIPITRPGDQTDQNTNMEGQRLSGSAPPCGHEGYPSSRTIACPWATANSVLDRRAQILTGGLRRKIQAVVILDFKNLRTDLHADGVCFTAIVIDDDFHTHAPSLEYWAAECKP